MMTNRLESGVLLPVREHVADAPEKPSRELNPPARASRFDPLVVSSSANAQPIIGGGAVLGLSLSCTPSSVDPG